MQTYKNVSVVSRWVLLPVVAVVVCYIAMIAGGFLDGLLFNILLPVAAILFLMLCARLAPSHKRTVAVATFIAGVAFVVQSVPYPNVGLPFGYWRYPNRAITAFLNCPNVQSAKLSAWNQDQDLEEFQIAVAFSDQNGRPMTQQISFAQYPTREYIAARVATIGCRSPATETAAWFIKRHVVASAA